MRQRAMIAMALVCRPKLLIADEPTTALDTTVQAQILDLIRAEAKAAGSAVLLITHDLGIVSGMADRVVVLYAGSVVESGPTAAVFSDPRHPWSRLSRRPRAQSRGVHSAFA
jgi:ABC-type dipeptide/oligopeptide/nickel transport system ATPase component